MEYTEEQQKILEDVYQLTDEGAFNEEDRAVLQEMFADPKSFNVLRKAMGLLRIDECSLFRPLVEQSVNPAQSDEDLGKELRFKSSVNDSIRGKLLNVYLLVQEDVKAAKKAEIDAETAEKDRQAKINEEIEEQIEKDQRTVGPNL